MSAVSPLADFSFDYQDLYFVRRKVRRTGIKEKITLRHRGRRLARRCEKMALKVAAT